MSDAWDDTPSYGSSANRPQVMKPRSTAMQQQTTHHTTAIHHSSSNGLPRDSYSEPSSLSAAYDQSAYNQQAAAAMASGRGTFVQNIKIQRRPQNHTFNDGVSLEGDASEKVMTAEEREREYERKRAAIFAQDHSGASNSNNSRGRNRASPSPTVTQQPAAPNAQSSSSRSKPSQASGKGQGQVELLDAVKSGQQRSRNTTQQKPSKEQSDSSEFDRNSIREVQRSTYSNQSYGSREDEYDRGWSNRPAEPQFEAEDFPVLGRPTKQR